MTMTAAVLQVQDCALLVCDQCTNQEVLVHTGQAQCFCPGDRVGIGYTGAMTMSIRPQIFALCVTKAC